MSTKKKSMTEALAWALDLIERDENVRPYAIRANTTTLAALLLEHDPVSLPEPPEQEEVVGTLYGIRLTCDQEQPAGVWKFEHAKGCHCLRFNEGTPVLTSSDGTVLTSPEGNSRAARWDLDFD